MKDLFDDLYMGFFEQPDLQLVKIQENQQVYFDHLAEMLILGQGYLPNLTNFKKRELIERSLTQEEEDILYFRIAIWLEAMN